MNRTSWERLEQVTSEYRRLASDHPEALREIALAEIAEAVQQSNAIENSTLTLDDTERILAGLSPRGRRELREVYEARNLALVTEDLLTTDDPLSEEQILGWHRTLLSGIRDDVAGRYRRGSEWVRVGGRLGANPAFVVELTREALSRFAADDRPVWEHVAWFHCEFEAIHPFVDGNGRIGRVIMNKQLHDVGLPPIIVRARNRRVDYYPLLEEYGRRYGQRGAHDGMTRLVALQSLEAMHKRITLITHRRAIPLAEWARASAISAPAATNKARRQTIPAFRVRDRWMIAEDYRV